MSKEEKAALKHDAAEFVRNVVTEVYGQRPTKKAVETATKRVVDAVLSATLAGSGK